MIATQIVHWPGQDTAACDDHARMAAKVAEAMGFRLATSSLAGFPEQSCTNCENEAKKRAAE